MNTQSVKQLIWVGALGLSAALAWEVFDFSKNKVILEKYVDRDRIEKAIYGDVEDKVVESASPTVRVASLNDGFGNLNWTGKQEVIIALPGPKGIKEVVEPKDMVEDLLTITMMGYSADAGRAFAYVAFLNPELETLMSAPSDRYLSAGESLKGKFSHIEVEGIEADGVRFKFNGVERESELVKFDPYGSGGFHLSVLGEGDLRPLNSALRNVSDATALSFRRPARTTETRRNHFQLGIESMAEVNRDYTRILSNDIRYRRARDRSNKVKGLEITKVTPGSIPAEAGLVPGEVLISVNGHQVTSESDLVNFIKRESATTTQWEAVFELNGKQFTRMYTSPDN